MNNLLSLTSDQLIKAANIKVRIETLTKELNALLCSSDLVGKSAKKRGMSAAGRAAVSAAAKLRWANVKAAKTKTAPKAAKLAKKTYTMSSAAKTKISIAAKARWAKIKGVKAGKK